MKLRNIEIKFHEFMTLAILILSSTVVYNLDYAYEDKVDAYCHDLGYKGGDALDKACFNVTYTGYKLGTSVFERHYFSDEQFEKIKHYTLKEET